jgi:hypothetical protein
VRGEALALGDHGTDDAAMRADYGGDRLGRRVRDGSLDGGPNYRYDLIDGRQPICRPRELRGAFEEHAPGLRALELFDRIPEDCPCGIAQLRDGARHADPLLRYRDGRLDERQECRAKTAHHLCHK